MTSSRSNATDPVGDHGGVDVPVFETEMADAARAGRAAARVGTPRTDNPHQPVDDAGRVLRVMWWRGWDDHMTAVFPAGTSD